MRRAFLSTMQSDKITARHIVFKMDGIKYVQQLSFYLRAHLRAWNAAMLQDEEYTPMPIVCASTSSRAIHTVTRDTLLSRGFMYV